MAQPPSQITIVVTVAAGGSSDIGTRTIAAKVEQLGGPQIVVENCSGGGGVTATLGVKDAAPDGRTLLLSAYATFVVNPAMPGGAPYDPVADFQQITTLFSFPVMLAVHSSVEARSVAELIALAKRKPGGLSYASQGVGTAGHLLGELFARSAGVPLLHVPYRGAAPAMIDLVAGRVDMMFVGILPRKAHLDSGVLRVLGVTSKTRMPEVPDAPTMAEAGHPDVDSEFVWFGLAAPAKTPEPVIRSLHDLFGRAIASPDVKDKLAAQGIIVGASKPEALAARIKADTARFGPLIKASGAAK
ncbi:MAG: tripartite tricarboxylate transporter substrate binding protein [Xanthobacteraceae bacterium]|nr:tripartite tricarboxylate transporter substrate binding protein [Xanthobacteraceae bacterium]